MNTALLAKAKAGWKCERCASTEFIAAHHQIPRDDSSIIVLCGECHSKEHPKVPKPLFFAKSNQPYWVNRSAASIAKWLKVHPRTIIRRARKLGIGSGYIYEPGLNILAEDNAKRKKEAMPKIKRPLPNTLRAYGRNVNSIKLYIPKRLCKAFDIKPKTPFAIVYSDGRVIIRHEV